MDEHWRLGHQYNGGHMTLMEVREGGPESGSRFVCTATPADAEQIVADHGAGERLAEAEQAIRDALYDYDHGDELSAVDRLRAALSHTGAGQREGAHEREWQPTCSTCGQFIRNGDQCYIADEDQQPILDAHGNMQLECSKCDAKRTSDDI